MSHPIPEDHIQQQREDMALLQQQFPRIALRIVELWGTRACLEYLDDLAIDHRGDRQGFPQEVFLALARIRQFHAEKHPGVALGHSDIWALNNSK